MVSGYYADEVAGCQVFHVCHDVLVSSFLCPIGSIFSQKLLTCDWWTKVDCSSSGKYVDVNRDSYQQDDDEMIRNAYAMISLRSGTDVTRDGLVDPDRTASIVDYHGIPDYSPSSSSSSVDAPSANDLSFEDHPRRPLSSPRDFLLPYRRVKEMDREKFHPSGQQRSSYEDSAVIRVQKIGDPGYEGRRKGVQEASHRRGGKDAHFQPSYAPTVPTVTTTTRRFYSPTVPTTFRPSTLAYNSLVDQAIDSSDYYFSGGKAFVTPPPVRLPSRKEEEDYGGSYEEEDGRFRVRVVDVDRNGTYGFEEDFETRGSIGLGQALRQSLRGIQEEGAKGSSLAGKEEDAKGGTSEAPSTIDTPPLVVESAAKATTTETSLLEPSDLPSTAVTEFSNEFPPRGGKFQIRVPDSSTSLEPESYPSLTTQPFASSEEHERPTTALPSVAPSHRPNSDETPSLGRTESAKTTITSEEASSNATLAKIRWKSGDNNKNDSPYQVTVTMNKREQLVPVDGDWGGAGGRELEIRESVEPPRSTTESSEEGSKISLRRLMSELLKLDRVPRPFSSSSPTEEETGDAELRARILYDILAATTRHAVSKEGWSPRSRGILDRLNFGGEALDLPGEERAVDFGGGSVEEEATTPSSSTTTKVEDEGRTVVRTEFVPSLGFSLDTDEGREEYVEAVLGGLIEPRAAGSEKGEAILERKNGTLEGKV